MATYNDVTRGFTPNTAMSAYIRVTVSANGAINPSAGEIGAGILLEDTAGNSYEVPKVRFANSGSCPVAVTGNGTTAITPGASIGTTANGYLCASPFTNFWGVALQGSGTTTGAVIEALELY